MVQNNLVITTGMHILAKINMAGINQIHVQSTEDRIHQYTAYFWQLLNAITESVFNNLKYHEQYF